MNWLQPTNLQIFTQKDLTKVKIFQKVLGGYIFKHPVHVSQGLQHPCQKSTMQVLY